MKTTVTLKQASSKFSEKLTCVEFVNENVCMQLVEDNNGVGDVHVVLQDGVNVGKLELLVKTTEDTMALIYLNDELIEEKQF